MNLERQQDSGFNAESKVVVAAMEGFKQRSLGYICVSNKSLPLQASGCGRPLMGDGGGWH